MKNFHRVDEEILTIVKRIYNACQKLKTEPMYGRSVMQQLVKLIVDHNYIYNAIVKNDQQVNKNF